MNVDRFTAPLWDLDTFYVWNDFEKDQVDTDWVDTITDSGTVAIGDAMSGIATLTPSDGSVVDNDEAYFATANELWKFAANRPIYGRFRFALTNTTLADPNFAVGFQNAVGADSIVDNGGVKTSGSTLCLEKKDGETVWRFTTACNGTAVTTLSNKTVTVGSTTWHDVHIHCNDYDGTNMQASCIVDGEYLKDANNVVIRHLVPIASATEMQMWAGVKLGASTNNDTMLLDFAYGAQRRAAPTT